MQNIKSIETAITQAIYKPSVISPSNIVVWAAKNTVVSYLVNKLTSHQFTQPEIDAVINLCKKEAGLLHVYYNIIIAAVVSGDDVCELVQPIVAEH